MTKSHEPAKPTTPKPQQDSDYGSVRKNEDNTVSRDRPIPPEPKKQD